MMRPPKWLYQLFRFFSPVNRPDLEGDFLELYEQELSTKSRWRVNLKWTFNCIGLWPLKLIVHKENLRKPVLFNQNLHLMLLKNYSITALRSFRKTKLLTSLQVLSLVLGISCFILISIYVLNEFSFNRHFAKSNRIGRISLSVFTKASGERVDFVWSNVQLRKQLLSSYEEVEEATGILKLNKNIVIKKNGKIFSEDNFYQADPHYFRIFTHEWKGGDVTSALERPGRIVITEHLAKKYFSTEDPIGMLLNVNDRDYEITGVIDNLPVNTDLRFNALISLDSDFEDWCQTYVLFKSARSLKRFQDNLDLLFEEHARPILANTGSDGSYHLEPLRELHFGSKKIFDTPKGNKAISISFLSIAFIVLIVAGINYVNISIAKSAKKQSEIGIRKVFGALRNQIRGQYIIEALLVTTISSAIAFAIVAYLLPILQTHQIINVSLKDWINLRTMGYLIIFILLISIVSGIYPAFIMVRDNVIKNLNGNLRVNTNNLFHRIMVLAHFTISISLIFATFIATKQIKLLLESDPGYNKDQVIVVDIPQDESLEPSLPLLKNELNQLSSVASSSFTTHYSIPTSEMWLDVYLIDESFKWLNFIRIDEDYFDVLELKIVNGRVFDPGERSVVVNEALVNSLGWEDPLGKTIWNSKVIGVVKDFSFRGLNPSAEPIQFQHIDRYGDQPEKILIRLNDPNSENIGDIKRVWESIIADYPFEFSFLDSYYQQQFEKEQTAKILLGYLSMLAIVIACMGLFGIVYLEIEQKNKETCIRKIFGARILHLISLTWIKYGILIAISITLAYPITVLVINKWLQSFSIKTTIDIMSLAKTSIIVIGLVLIIIVFQIIKIFRTDPLESIRYE